MGEDAFLVTPGQNSICTTVVLKRFYEYIVRFK